MSVSKLQLKTSVPLVLSLGLANLLTYTDILDVLVLNPIRKKLRFIHKYCPGFLAHYLEIKWTSNIPSSPYAMDALSTMIAGPFPSLVDHNACMPGLTLPCVLRGRPPPKLATYWSVQIYMKEAANVMNERKGGSQQNGEGDAERRNQTLRDIDVQLEEDGTYEIFIGDWEGEKPAKNCIRANGSRKGLLVIRAFNVPSGSSWRVPEIFDDVTSDQSNPRPTNFEGRVSGPFASKLGTSVWTRSKTLFLSQCMLMMARPDLTRLLLPGAACGAALHRLLTIHFRRKYKRMRQQKEPNKAFQRIPGLGGNADHLYFTMTYDVSEVDVCVEGVLECTVEGSPGLRYFNFTCYEWDSLPLSSYADSLNVVPSIVQEDAGPINVTKRYKIFITDAPTYETNVNEINVGPNSKGTCTVRILLPASREVDAAVVPMVRVVPKGNRE